MGVINNDAKVKIGERLVCIGVGGVGLNIIQGASLVCAFPIVAVDIVDWKLKLAQKFGATHVLNSKEKDIVKSVKNIVGEGGADIVVDTTGKAKVIEKAYEVTASMGKTILVGVP